ncbi:MAG: aspartate ammonia-lyase, partial [Silvanigrellaceae bacterium]|nr:aspartate ammonia-lyase [Silvanigrellaceae bacterium]
KILFAITSHIFNEISRGLHHEGIKYVGYNSGKKRIEHDLLGERQVPYESLYGIQTLRGQENFYLSGVSLNHFPLFIKALTQVKKAAAQANHTLGLLENEKAYPIIQACDEIISGHWHNQFILDMIQGGAGTSTNMNVNEVIANRALEIAGKNKGEYEYIHPNNHVNLSQSTNDVYPTAIRLAILQFIPSLLDSLKELCEILSEKSKEFSKIIKMGRTQLQDAVPMTLGQEFGAFAEMLREDIPLLHETSDLFYPVNLGGTAIGTKINAHPKYPQLVIEKLRDISQMPICSSPNLIEATPNTSVFVLFSSLLKSLAIKLNKISNDLRLLSSGPRCGFNDITLPAVQPGSSIMPGKINPVIPEVVNQVAFQVIGNDLAISMAAQAGQLQLNAFEPLIVFNLFQNIQMLNRAMKTLGRLCIAGIKANSAQCRSHVENSIGLVTALSPLIGYEHCSRIAKEALETGESIFNLVLKHNLMSREALEEILKPENMVGF